MVKVALPETFDRGAFGIEKPGHYHLMVMGAEEYPMKKNGEPIKGWRIHCGVLAGTESSEVGKEVQLILSHPDGSHSDGGDFCRRVQGRFLLATGLVQEDQAGREIDVDLEKGSPGRQFVAKFALRKKTKATDPDRFDLDGANLWHVDDPFVRDFPKSEQDLKSLPAHLRMISGKEPSKKTAAATSGNSKPSPSPAQYSEQMGSKFDESMYDDL